MNLTETEIEAEKENVEASGMEIVNDGNEEVHIEQEKVEQHNSADEPMESEDSKDACKREAADEDGENHYFLFLNLNFILII